MQAAFIRARKGMVIIMVFTYGFDEAQLEGVRWHLGETEYIDVSDAYQDIMALEADIVVVNLDSCDEDVLAIIKNYEEETRNAEERKYLYVTEEQCEEWQKELYFSMTDKSRYIYEEMTPEQIRMISYVQIHNWYHDNGYIANVKKDEPTGNILIDFFHIESGAMELIIMADDEDVRGEDYQRWNSSGKYDVVSVAWVHERQNQTCLQNMYLGDISINELPPLLRPTWQSFLRYTKRERFAIEGIA